MNAKYILTGYDKTKKKINTRVYNDIDSVAEVINKCETGEVVWTEGEKLVIKSTRDLDFDVHSRRTHNGAELINTEKFAWSVFLLK